MDHREKFGMLSFLSHYHVLYSSQQKNELLSPNSDFFSNLSLSLKDFPHVAPSVYDLSRSVSTLKQFLSSQFKFKLF